MCVCSGGGRLYLITPFQRCNNHIYFGLKNLFFDVRCSLLSSRQQPYWRRAYTECQNESEPNWPLASSLLGRFSLTLWPFASVPRLVQTAILVKWMKYILTCRNDLNNFFPLLRLHLLFDLLSSFSLSLNQCNLKSIFVCANIRWSLAKQTQPVETKSNDDDDDDDEK